MNHLHEVNAPVFYLKHSSGKKHGPYAARSVAEGVLSQMPASSQSEYVVECYTASGSQMLFG